jgi:hypothetical protein
MESNEIADFSVEMVIIKLNADKTQAYKTLKSKVSRRNGWITAHSFVKGKLWRNVKKDINKIALEWFVSTAWRDSNSLKILQAEIKEKAEKLNKAILKLQTYVWKVRK